MQSPGPRVPHQPASRRPEIQLGRLTAELATVVASARRRALRDGDRQIDTAHLLHSLIESDPEVGAAFEGGADRGGAPQLARVLGYLVQRSIGYGLRWRGSVEDSGALYVVRDESAAVAQIGGAAGAGAPGVAGAAAGWSPTAAAAMDGAWERAALRGEPRARGLDLLAVIAADPESRAVEVLRRAGVDPLVLTDRIGELSQQV
ncbi:Clp protease N-terminal domain-containing protein [Streptomyces sp. P9(2023)]|uniref:Clp protease N-terminal domain-containing protein n=1 Tax=Streptomyces sp. P9(2023) TaxID=3064394 RepID=UPI0028F3F4E4|nr:Clp protease N-terminal domain-containing protein [Streptomyces sp. P9(2023)]MDT9691931.1 Clp protease N-terminal domain-containing protein [Streptomyces sp. P9(2023)]